MCTNLALCMQAAVVLYALPSAHKLQAQTGAASHFWKIHRIQGPGESLLGLGLPRAATFLHEHWGCFRPRLLLNRVAQDH